MAKSDKDFLNKLKMVEEELDETNHWIDIIMRTGMLPLGRMSDLHIESKELLNIISKSIVTMKARIKADEDAKKNSK